MRRITLVIIFALPAFCLRADPSTATFTPSNDNVQSAQLQSDYNTNMVDGIIGAGQIASGITMDSLLRFDLSSLAGQYSTIDSITLTLHLAYVSETGEFNVYAVSPADDGWGTTSGMGPTWDYENYGSSTPWAGSAGLQTSGTDYNSTVLAYSGFTNAISIYTLTLAGNSTALTSLVNGWNSGENGGLLINSSNTNLGAYVEFYGGTNSIFPNDSYLPQLTVTYDPVAVPEPDALLLLGVTSLVVIAACRCRPAKRG